MGNPRPLFNSILAYSNKQIKFYNKLCEKESNQFPVPGIELVTLFYESQSYNH